MEKQESIIRGTEIKPDFLNIDSDWVGTWDCELGAFRYFEYIH